MSRQEVVVLGAGFAGLSAGHDLANEDIKVTILEGQGSVGGRAGPGGGELINADHVNVLSVADACGVELRDTYFGADQQGTLNRIIIDGISHTVAELKEASKELRAQVSSDGQRMVVDERFKDDLDKTDLQTYIDRLNAPGWVKKTILLHQLQEMGIEPSRQSARFFVEYGLTEMIGGQTPNLFVDGYGRYLVPGGSSKITDSLAQKTEQQGATIELNRMIESIRPSTGGRFEITTADSPSSPVIADKIVCSLPFSVLRHIDGIDTIGLSEGTMRGIREMDYGTNGKVEVTLSGDAIKHFKLPQVNIFLSNTCDAALWTQAQVADSELRISVYYGGEAGARVTSEVSERDQRQIVKAIEECYGQLPAGISIQMKGANWADNKFARGSYSAATIGSQPMRDGLQISNAEGAVQVIGEHMSEDYGYMNSAIETGFTASSNILSDAGFGPGALSSLPKK